MAMITQEFLDWWAKQINLITGLPFEKEDG